jgi:hypothetical protein
MKIEQNNQALADINNMICSLSGSGSGAFIGLSDLKDQESISYKGYNDHYQGGSLGRITELNNYLSSETSQANQLHIVNSAINLTAKERKDLTRQISTFDQ